MLPHLNSHWLSQLARRKVRNINYILGRVSEVIVYGFGNTYHSVWCHVVSGTYFLGWFGWWLALFNMHAPTDITMSYGNAKCFRKGK